MEVYGRQVPRSCELFATSSGLTFKTGLAMRRQICRLGIRIPFNIRGSFYTVNEFCLSMRSARCLLITQDVGSLASFISCSTVEPATSEHGGARSPKRLLALGSTAIDGT